MANPNLPINYKKNTYIGARYVPVFSDTPGSEWDNSISYEPLVIVLHEGNSYTSKTFVPVGVDINNTSYWALTGNFNAQLAQVLEELEKLMNLVIEIYPEDNVSPITQSLFKSYQNSIKIQEDNLSKGILRAATFNYAYSREWYDSNYINQVPIDVKVISSYLNIGCNIISFNEFNSNKPTVANFLDRMSFKNFNNAYYPITLDGNISPSSITKYMDGRFIGNSILSNLTLAGQSVTELYAGNDNNERRSMSHVNFNYNGKLVSYYNLHLTDGNSELQVIEMAKVRQVLEADSNPLIVCAGDFNMDYDDLQPLTPSGFSIGNTAFNTYPSTSPRRSIDNVIYKGFSKVKDGVVNTGASDHLMYWIDLK